MSIKPQRTLDIAQGRIGAGERNEGSGGPLVQRHIQVVSWQGLQQLVGGGAQST
jgi:hypothetical protein